MTVIFLKCKKKIHNRYLITQKEHNRCRNVLIVNLTNSFTTRQKNIHVPNKVSIIQNFKPSRTKTNTESYNLINLM